MKPAFPVVVLFSGWLLLGMSVPVQALKPSDGPVILPRELASLHLKVFTGLSARDYTRLTGTRLKTGERLSFYVLKWKMKKFLRKNPEATVGQYLTEGGLKGGNKVLLIILIVMALLLFIPLLIFFFSSKE